MRSIILTLMLLLSLCFVGCVENGQQAETTQAQQEISQPSEQTSEEKDTEVSSGIPNVPSDGYTKRY